MQQLDPATQFPSIKLKSLISYPTEAQVGKKYLMTIDAQLDETDTPWPYPEEEYEISLQLNLHPFFSYQSLVGNTPTIILHRFGGTYGPAEFILTANTEIVPKANIKITFRNASGLKIARFELPCEVRQEVKAQSKPGTTTVMAPSTDNIYPPHIPPPVLTHDVTLPHIEQIEQQLEQVGWAIIEYERFKDRNWSISTEENPDPLLTPFVAVKSVPYYPEDYALVIMDELVGFVKTQLPDKLLNDGQKTVPSLSFTRILKISCNHSLIPFVYDATGIKTQITNKLEINPQCREVFTFHQPETLQRWLDSVPDMFAITNNLFRSRIQNLPQLKKGTLRSHQFEALQQIEQALKQQQSRILIQMETGEGKTYTLIHSINRLLTYGGAKHILYLVDTPIARRYAMDAFRRIRPNENDHKQIIDDASTFAELYNVQPLTKDSLDPNAQVTVATLNDIYSLLTGQIIFKPFNDQDENDAPLPVKYNKSLPIEYFDAIFIVDSEYIQYNRWKSLLLYFDAPIIGTADHETKELKDFFQQKFPYPSQENKEEIYKQLANTIYTVLDRLRDDIGFRDYLPQITRLLLLKNLDDFEMVQEEMYGENYNPIITKPYRWRDWVIGENQANQRTGAELLKFVNRDLTDYLKNLSGENSRDLRTIVSTIFKETNNRIRSGNVLRDVVNKLNSIDFNASNDIEAFSQLYENMLKEMHDTEKKQKDFYTTRAVVRFIIDRLNPQLGERIMDPACGTAGFLVEAYTKMLNQIKTLDQKQQLFGSLIGIENDPMIYLLAIMNELLHGIESPAIVERNAFAVNINQISNDEQVDIIATHPPFSGQENDDIANNFPSDMRTNDTVLLFIQYTMALLKRPGGRTGIVIPNGFLFRKGIALTIREKLIKQFSLHTIVRLPSGVFSPGTGIPASVLFFEAEDDLYPSSTLYPSRNRYPSGVRAHTQEIWYYEISPPEGYNTYINTRSIQTEDFQACIDWWDKRIQNAHAWKVSIEEIIENGYNLDFKNPHTRGNI